MASLLRRSKSLKSKLGPKDQSSQPGTPEPDTFERGMIKHNNHRVSPPTFGTHKLYADTEPPRPRTAGDATSSRIKAHISFNAEDETFHFPTPVSRPFSSKSPTVTSSPGPIRSETPDTIGLAIGSPSQAPPNFQSFRSPAGFVASQEIISPKSISTLSLPRRDNEARDTKLEGSAVHDGARTKISRWRSLGGLFGGRKASSTGERTPTRSPLPAVTVTRVEDWSNGTVTDPLSTAAEVPSKGTQKKKKGRTGVVRAATLPIRSEQSSPAPSPRIQPMLEVSIPDVRMERYSVMFNGLLPQQRLSSHRSSLLARRQANNEKPTNLKPLDLDQRGSLRPSRRRATSPEPSASPSMRLMLFPPESSRGQPIDRNGSLINRPRPLRRTRTAPSALSPVPTTEERVPGQLSPTYESDELLYSSRQGTTPTPSTPSQPATPGDERPRTAANGKPGPWNYTLIEEEPAWEMLTVRDRSGSKDSDSVHITEDISVRRAKDEDWHYTAEVSMARSLSVTRPRMQLLRPVKVDNERLFETKALTPTLVDARDRKSVAVQIEGA